MADTPCDSPQHVSPPERDGRTPWRQQSRPPVTPPRTDSDSLSSILKGIQKLAGDLKRNPAAQRYAQQADDLADRLKRVI
jgi:hypothetical protein